MCEYLGYDVAEVKRVVAGDVEVEEGDACFDAVVVGA